MAEAVENKEEGIEDKEEGIEAVEDKEEGIEERVWLFAGLGSRGLIHHAVLGKALAAAILHCDEALIPAPARRIHLLGGPDPSAAAPLQQQGRRVVCNTNGNPPTRARPDDINKSALL